MKFRTRIVTAITALAVTSAALVGCSPSAPEPDVERTLTLAEWEAIGAHSRSQLTPDTAFVVFGMLMEEAPAPVAEMPRRAFLKLGAASGFALGLYPLAAHSQSAAEPLKPVQQPSRSETAIQGPARDARPGPTNP